MNDQEQTLAAGSDTDAATIHDSLALRRGTLLGRYCILEEIGRGAMGVVYAAYDPKLDRRVAVKVVRGDASPRATSAMLLEAQALARLNHPAVVSIYDVGEHRGGVFMAMEFVVGVPVRHWVQARKRSVTEVLQVFARAATGLAAAHTEGLVHRDFKPDNVMVAQDGRVLVMDFGLAVRDGAAPTEGERGWAVGTPAYMSPEQFAGKPVDARSDQFSFFVALYEAIATRRPFAGRSVPELAVSVASGTLIDDPPLPRVRRWVRRMVLRGLEARPDDRHPSMDEVVRILDLGLRRRTNVGLVLAAAGGLAMAGWTAASRNDPDCRASAAELRQTWSTQWAPQIRTALQDGLAHDAQDTWQRAERNVDAFVSEWASASDEACVARHDTGSLDGPSFGARIRCLEDQHVYVGGLVEAVTGAEPQMLWEITAATAELPRPQTCTTVQADDDGFDPAEQARIDAVQRKAARAEGLARAGRVEPARRLLTECLDDLQGLEAARTRATVLAALGHQHYDAADLPKGREAMQDALLWASRSGDASTIAETWLTRVEHVLLEEKDSATARSLLEAAQVAVAALPEDAAMLGRLESLRGLLALDLGQTTEARDRFLAALEHARRAAPKVSRQSALLGQLAAAEFGLSNLDRSRRYAEQNLELVVATWGEHHPLVARLHGNLGYTCWRLGDETCAREHMNIARDLTPPGDPQHAKALLMLGQFEYDHGRYQQAGRRAQGAIAIYVEHYGENYPGLTSPRLLLANVLRRAGDLDGALEQAQRMVTLSEGTTPVGHPKRGVAKSTLGNVLRERDEFEPALAAHLEALEIRERALDAGDARIGYSQVGVAACLLDLERFADAEAMAQRAMELFAVVPGTDSWRAEARFLLARATVHHDERRAQTLAREALRLYESIGDGGATEAEEIRHWFRTRDVTVTPG